MSTIFALAGGIRYLLCGTSSDTAVRGLSAKGHPLYILSLHIHDLRCFRKVDLNFQFPGREDSSLQLPNINLVLGNNGVGKSTILKAIALAALSPVLESAGFVPYHLVRRDPFENITRTVVEGRVLLHAQDVGSSDKESSTSEVVRAVIDQIRDNERIHASQQPTGYWENMYDDQSPAFLVVGYGANRRVESSSSFDEGLRLKSRQLRYQRVSSLFEEQVTLIPLSAWLPRMRNDNPGRYKQVKNLINRLLPDECRFEAELENGDYLFQHRGVPVPFGAMSDGYRAYIGWITDLLYHVCMGAPRGAKLVDNKGIVLVDEVDLHLHPEWQRTVIPRLAASLPNLQFVLSSHSPIVAGTLESRNIFVTDSDETDASTVRQLREHIHGLSAEQILLSSYFNLASTRAPGMIDELWELSQRAQTGDPEAALAFLRRLADGSEVPDEQETVGVGQAGTRSVE